jgi:hypothetical protein
MDLDITLMRRNPHFSVNIDNLVTTQVLRQRNYGNAVHSYFHSQRGIHLHTAVIEDEFISLELNNGVRLDSGCGPLSVDFRPIAFLRLH